ncbi:MAG: sigma-70 family RNA polymerase sigma factor, partial [Gaiellaceae bacterium]
MTFAQAAEEHLDDVYGYLVYLTHDRGLAEELTGDAFERALRLWSRYDARKGSVKTWLCQVARTTALDHFRAEKRRRRREAEYALGERAAEEAPLAEGLSPELER